MLQHRSPPRAWPDDHRSMSTRPIGLSPRAPRDGVPNTIWPEASVTIAMTLSRGPGGAGKWIERARYELPQTSTEPSQPLRISETGTGPVVGLEEIAIFKQEW